MLPRVFYGYPSEPPDLGETLETAITKLNRSYVVQASSWKSLQATGTVLKNAVCDAIDKAQVFCCDLTYINQNVLFELGYAIARNKPIWISLNPSIKDAKSSYSKLRALTTAGYAPYNDSESLVDQFFSDTPWEVKTIFREAIEPSIAPTETPFIFYLKSSVASEASNELTRRLANSSIGRMITDDPDEVATQPLTWYGVNTH